MSKHINTAFIERNNLSLRQYSKRLGRKTKAFSKDKPRLEGQLHLASAHYHFVKPHLGLRPRDHAEETLWLQRSPAMPANITDHIWPTRAFYWSFSFFERKRYNAQERLENNGKKYHSLSVK